MRRRGVALVAVLWVMVAMTALALTMQLVAREAVLATTRRTELQVGHWRAEECLARARAVIDAALATERHSLGPSSPAWRELERTLRDSPLLADCTDELSIAAAGSVVDVNDASAEQLRRLLAASTRLVPLAADSLVDAILDWRDEDDVLRASGAERAWYAAENRHLPRNGPFADGRELQRVRGMEAVGDALAILGIESGRLSLAIAPLRVLASLPGMTPGALARLEELRTSSEPPTTLAAFAGLLPPFARDSIHASFAELSRLATIDPEMWIVTARARRDEGAAAATIELRLVRSGTRAVVVRSREWP